MSKLKTSNLWNCFEEGDSNTKVATCKICRVKLSYKSSTSNLRKHLERKHPTIQFVTSKQPPQPPSQPPSQPPPQSLPEPAAATTVATATTTASTATIPLATSTTSIRVSAAAAPAQFQQPPQLQQAQANWNQTLARYVKRKLTPTEKKKLDDLLMQLFIFDYQPFSIVEDRGFRAFVGGLNPSYILPDRKTLSNNFLPAMYETCLAQVQEELKLYAESVCLTTDIWTSSVNDAYLGLTAHYIDDNFNMKSALLECAALFGAHTAENIKENVMRILEQFKLTEKVLIIVSDNASNMKSAVEKMGFRHFGCYAHTLNLIVKYCTTENTADDTVKYLIIKVKSIVSHYKKSVKATEKLIVYQRQNGEAQPKKVLQDVSTRWNSTLKMLERFVLLENAIKATTALSDERMESLTAEEWRICRELCIVLKPFDQLTETMSAENYVSGSQILILTRGLMSALTEMLRVSIDEPEEPDFVDTLHEATRRTIVSLRLETERRFPNLEASKTIGISTFLDPRFKLHVFRNQTYASDVKKTVVELITNNIKRTLPRPSQSSEQTTEEPLVKRQKFDIWSEYDTIMSTARPEGTPSSNAIQEVQRYLELPVLGKKENPLDWWRSFQPSFPNLAVFARKRLNFLATSVPCERLFSKAGNLVNERRTRLGVRKVKQLLFLNSNYKPTNTNQ